MPSYLKELAQIVYPSMDAAVIKGFMKGLSKERVSFYWEILDGAERKVTIMFPTEK